MIPEVERHHKSAGTHTAAAQRDSGHGNKDGRGLLHVVTEETGGEAQHQCDDWVIQLVA